MHGWTNRWLACFMASAILCAASAAAWAQDGAFPVGPTDPAYAAPSGPYGMAPEVPATEANYNNAMLGEKDLAKEVAELKATVKKLADKAAADKKKADADKKKAAESFSAKVGGRIFYDTYLFGQNAASMAASPAGLGDIGDTSMFRAARIQVEGKGFDVAFYKIELDLSGRSDFTTGAASAGVAHTHTVGGVGQVLVKDCYIGIEELPILGRVQAGHFKEPFSLEEITSNRFITFMERGLPNAFSPARNLGVMSMNVAANERGTFGIGIFRQVGENPPFLSTDDAGNSVAGRLTYLPWYDEATNGRGLIHVGLSYRFVEPDNPTQRIAARSEVGSGPTVVDTNLSTQRLTNVDYFQTINPEIAFVYGPFSIQAEYMGSFYRRVGGPDAYFNGAYAYVSYFLTGENRNYKKTSGCFDRVKVNESFFRVRDEDGYVQTGKGAWEVAYRYSYLDLDDPSANILGGFAADHTFGVNWYLNSHMRLMFNLVHNDTGRPQDNPNVFIDCYMFRAQADY